MQIETVTVTCQGHSRTEQQRWTEIFVFPSHSPVPCHKAILHLSLLPQSKNTSFLFAYLAAVLSTGDRVLLSEQGTSGSGGWSNRDTWELVSLLEAWHSCCALERPPDSYSTLRFRASWSQWRQGEFAARTPSDYISKHFLYGMWRESEGELTEQIFSWQGGRPLKLSSGPRINFMTWEWTLCADNVISSQL